MSLFPSKNVGHCFIHNDCNSIFLIIKKKKKKKKQKQEYKRGKSREIYIYIYIFFFWKKEKYCVDTAII